MMMLKGLEMFQWDLTILSQMNYFKGKDMLR